MYRHWPVAGAWLLTFAVWQGVGSAQEVSQMDRALEQSKLTGLPILAVIGKEG